MRILKLLDFWDVISLIFVSLFHFRPKFLFSTRSKESEHGPEIDSGTSFFLVQILKKLLYTRRMTRKFKWFYQPNLVMMRVGVSRMEKVGLVFYTVHSILPYSFFYKRVSVFLLYFPSLLYSWKSMNKFHFLRSVLQNRRSRMFTQENTCVGVSF